MGGALTTHPLKRQAHLAPLLGSCSGSSVDATISRLDDLLIAQASLTKIAVLLESIFVYMTSLTLMLSV